MTETRGYTENKDAVQKRLRRIEGQVRGVEGMVEEDRYCIDVVTQITAIQAGARQGGPRLFGDHARHCVIDAANGDQAEKTEETDGRGQCGYFVAAEAAHGGADLGTEMFPIFTFSSGLLAPQGRPPSARCGCVLDSSTPSLRGVKQSAPDGL